MTKHLRQEIQRLKKLEKKAAPAPWTMQGISGCYNTEDGFPCRKGYGNIGDWCDSCIDWVWNAQGIIIPEAFGQNIGEYNAMSDENTELITAMRNVLPEMLEVLENAEVWRQWYLTADTERSAYRRERDQLIKQSSEGEQIFLLFSCNKWKENSSMDLVVATTDRHTLEQVIRNEIMDKSMECNGLSGADGVAEFDSRDWEDGYGDLLYGFVNIVKNGEVQ